MFYNVLKAKDIINLGEEKFKREILMEDNNNNLSVIAIKKNEIIDTHTSTCDAAVYVIEGELELHFDAEKFKVDKGEIFKDNQTIRIIDQIATAIANVFTTKYLGQVPNDKDGRLSLWADVCKVHTELQDIRALENFDPKDITVEQGEAKKSVVINESITIVNTMVRLYMTVVVG